MARPKAFRTSAPIERDIADLDRAAEHIHALAESVARRAAREQVSGTTVHIKVKWSDFRITTRQRTLSAPTNASAALQEAALALLRDEIAPLLAAGLGMRLLGVGLSGITTPELPPTRGRLVQLRLFTQPD
jgi:DNA polymerase-4